MSSRTKFVQMYKFYCDGFIINTRYVITGIYVPKHILRENQKTMFCVKNIPPLNFKLMTLQF